MRDVTTWIFDLDNTLYPAGSGLFAQVETRMTAHVMRRLAVDEAGARRLRRAWKAAHGTTLAGLMADHGIDPLPYLDEVHDIDLGALRPDPALNAALRALPGRRIVHTNADAGYAGRVLAHRGIDAFDAIHGIAETGFVPKPDPRAYAAVLQAGGIDPARAAFFEDDARNLVHPHALGMTTVLVADGTGEDAPMPHVDHRTADLAGFLAALVARGGGVA